MADLHATLRRYVAACLSPDEAVAWADRRERQFPEQQWLAARLREAAAGRGAVALLYAVVIAREVLGPSATDEEVEASLEAVPDWLSELQSLA